MPVKILSGLIGFIGAIWLFPLGVWWEAGRPAGWPSYTLNMPFGIHHTFALPDGSGAKLKALRGEKQKWIASLNTCTKNTDTLKATLRRQNESVDALKRSGDEKLAAAQRALQASIGLAAAARTKADKLLALPLVSGDTCSRVLEVDAAFVSALK